MKKLACYILAITGLVLLAQAGVWSAVNISWTGGSVDLQIVDNPDKSVETYWPSVWYGELPIDFSSLNSIVLTGTGNLKAPSGDVVNVVRIKQVVTNNTNENWSDFHVKLDGGDFYKKWYLQGGWSASQSDSMFDFYANGGPKVAPGGIFTDGIEFVLFPDANGNATFTLTKWPTIPEPASMLAMLTGMVGFVGFIKRRR